MRAGKTGGKRAPYRLERTTTAHLTPGLPPSNKPKLPFGGAVPAWKIRAAMLQCSNPIVRLHMVEKWYEMRAHEAIEAFADMLPPAREPTQSPCDTDSCGSISPDLEFGVPEVPPLPRPHALVSTRDLPFPPPTW